MPKKFKGENSKAAEARQRAEDKKTIEKAKIDKEKEDILWLDDDKLANKKIQRKENLEKKKIETLQKKLENKKAYEEEIILLKGKSTSEKSINASSKVTQNQLLKQKNEELCIFAENSLSRNKLNLVQPFTLEENINKLNPINEGARNIEQALEVLSTLDIELDKHPERRMKAAYNAFEEQNLPRLKEENSNMRLSQLKQMLKKEWMKP
ncbi:unnamed protein product [Gordionus sp. m RMFG-2023]